MIIIFAHLLFYAAAMFAGEKKISYERLTRVHVSIGLIGEAQLSLFVMELFSWYMHTYMDMLAMEAMWNMWKNSLLLMHVHEHGNEYMACIMISAWKKVWMGKLVSCVLLTHFHRVVIYFIIVIYVFYSIFPCFIYILAKTCGSPYCTLMLF